MIANRVVLVVGAGASTNYGLPTASGLSHVIISDRNVGTLVSAGGFDEGKFRAMCNDLLASGEPSIDGFLETRPEYIEIGRVAIAAALLPREHRVIGPIGSDDWYAELLSWIRLPRFEDYSANRLSIITFNYDRSLENRLIQSIRGRFGSVSAESLRKCLSSLRIVHVHGTLGTLPELAGDSPEDQLKLSVPYGLESPDREQLLRSAAEIQIAGQVRDLVGYQKAREYLSDAEVVIFLGFGYHLELMARIGADSIPGSAKIFGTSFGMRGLHLDRAVRFLASKGAVVDIVRPTIQRSISGCLQDCEDRIEIRTRMT
jgi:hypothetical protein